MKCCTILVLLFFQSFSLTAQGEQYVFYLPGQIVEGAQENPESPLYGVYEYSEIVEALKGNGYIVISDKRSPTTISELYAKKIARQIDSLKSAGIKSGQITVIGASKGAIIAMMVSSFVRDGNVKYVLMGACNAANGRKYPIDLYGQILSIYESSDHIGRSCNSIRENPNGKGISVYKEVKLNTGLRHGFIYKPLKDWLELVKAWIEG